MKRGNMALEMAREEKRQQQRDKKKAQAMQRRTLVANGRKTGQHDSLSMFAKLQATQMNGNQAHHSVLSQIASKLAHAEEIDQRLNRRKETIIKLQNFLQSAGGVSGHGSDSDSSSSECEELGINHHTNALGGERKIFNEKQGHGKELKPLKQITGLANKNQLSNPNTTKHETEQTQVYDLNESKMAAHTMESLLDKSVESVEDPPKVTDKKQTIRSLRRDAINQRRRSSRLSAIADVAGDSTVEFGFKEFHKLIRARYC